MAAFYRDTLGLPVHSERPHFVAFEWGEMRFSIGEHSAVHGRNAEPDRIMVNFGTPDIHALHERLTGGGVFASSGRRSASTGAAGSPHSRTRTATLFSCWSSRSGELTLMDRMGMDGVVEPWGDGAHVLVSVVRSSVREASIWQMRRVLTSST